MNDDFSNTLKKKIARVSEQNDDGNYSLSAYLVAQLGKNDNNSSHFIFFIDEDVYKMSTKTLKKLQNRWNNKNYYTISSVPQ